jgi:nicotinate-nucleotide pyrophosphorylase (carboxylating)
MTHAEDAVYREAAREAVRRALLEDRAEDDITTLAIVRKEARATGRLLFREPAVLAGTFLFDETFRALDPGVSIEWSRGEGEKVDGGEMVARVEGSASALLRAERVALNFVMRLSGIATLTARFVEAAEGRVEILDTRKTTPGLRILEKAAVRAGGGMNHRMSLADLALIKENHIAAAGGIRAAVDAVRRANPEIAIEVEVRNIEELEEVLPLRVERVMLDNFDEEAIRAAVARIRREAHAPYIEISGGMDLEKARAAAALGVDGISIGALTHSAPAANVSFLIESGS